MSKSKNQKHEGNKSKVDKLREIVKNTEENIKEAEFSKEFSDGIQRKLIDEKNRRRKYSIKELKEEMKEEVDKK